MDKIFNSPLLPTNVYQIWTKRTRFTGFKQPLAACCGYGGLPLNFDARIACGVTKILNGTLVTAGPCNNTAEYINWDGSHYTEAANQFVSTQILSGKYLDPPLPAKTSFPITLQLATENLHRVWVEWNLHYWRYQQTENKMLINPIYCIV